MIRIIGSLYEILTKVLVNGLKKVIAKVVSKNQNAFVEDKQIFYATLITNEIIDSRKEALGQAW